jgi:uncharacterized protein YjbI with pentapeptide repeats
MNVFLLLIAIILLICYMLYLSRRKDFLLSKSPPTAPTLPRSKYDQALRELSEYQKQAPPKSRRKQMERNSQIYYLEQRLEQIQLETEKEQKSFYLAGKEREIAWKDHRDFFSNMNLFEKMCSPGKIKELVLLRNLYLESEKKLELEISKFNARTRIRHHEETVKQEREDEIEGNTRIHSQTDASGAEEPISEAGQDIQEAFDEMAGIQDGEIEDPAEKDIDEFEFSDPFPGEDLNVENSPAPPSRDHFSQHDIKERYPDYNGLTYVDESLSLEDMELQVIQDANFDGSFFVSVLFRGRHQYKDCSFQKTDFSYSNWQRAETPHRILSCDFTESNFSFAGFDYAAFYNCRFFKADFEETRFKTVKFVKCIFEECNLANVDFSHTVMSSDMLESIDFSKCAAPPKNYTEKKDLPGESPVPEESPKES